MNTHAKYPSETCHSWRLIVILCGFSTKILLQNELDEENFN